MKTKIKVVTSKTWEVNGMYRKVHTHIHTYKHPAVDIGQRWSSVARPCNWPNLEQTKNKNQKNQPIDSQSHNESLKIVQMIINNNYNNNSAKQQRKNSAHEA